VRRASALVNAIKGHWRITEIDVWDNDYIDLVEPAHIAFEGENDGASSPNANEFFNSLLVVWMRNLIGACDDLQGSGKRVWIGRFGAFVRQLRFGGETLAQDAVG
jgi:hypothetical protein